MYLYLYLYMYMYMYVCDCARETRHLGVQQWPMPSNGVRKELHFALDSPGSLAVYM